MADLDRTSTTGLLEDTDANSGVPTVCLEGRVASQTGPTWCVAIPGATTTTTDRNRHTDADPRRTVQSTTLGHNPAATEHQGGELDCLRTLRNHARSSFKAILAEVQRICTPLPAVCKLDSCLQNLVLEQACLKELDLSIIDLVDEELEDEALNAELYTDCFFRAKALLSHYIDCRQRGVLPEMQGSDRRLKELIARLEDRSAESFTRVSDVIRTHTKRAIPNEPNQQEPTEGNGEKSATLQHVEAETAPAEFEVARAPQEARVEYIFEYIFVPDFMKGEDLPERLEIMTTHAQNYPASSQFQESVRASVGPETGACMEWAPEDIATSEQVLYRRKRRRPGTSCQASFPHTVTAPKNICKSPIQTQKTPFNSLLKSYRKALTSRVAQHRLQPNRHVKGRETFHGSRHTVWLPSASTWRRLAVLKTARRCKHRWKQKTVTELQDSLEWTDVTDRKHKY